MDAKELRELIEIISRSNFSEFELEREGFKLKLVRGNTAPFAAPRMPQAPVAEAAPPDAAPVVEAMTVEQPAPAGAPANSGLVQMDSPIVGTFFRAPGPEKPAFVETGDRVKKGQVVCIIEAMKLMNEIESEIDAEVVEIVAVNGQPVEYGEALFKLRPL